MFVILIQFHNTLRDKPVTVSVILELYLQQEILHDSQARLVTTSKRSVMGE